MSQSLITIMSQTFEIPEGLVSQKTHQKDIEAWDSLGIITLVSSLEAEYDIEFDLEEIVLFNSVEAITKVLLDKGISPDVI